MGRKKSSEKLIEEQINEAFKKHANGIQIPIMKLGSIFDDAQADVLLNNMSVDDAVIKAVNKFKAK